MYLVGLSSIYFCNAIIDILVLWLLLYVLGRLYISNKNIKYSFIWFFYSSLSNETNPNDSNNMSDLVAGNGLAVARGQARLGKKIELNNFRINLMRYNLDNKICPSKVLEVRNVLTTAGNKTSYSSICFMTTIVLCPMYLHNSNSLHSTEMNQVFYFPKQASHNT